MHDIQFIRKQAAQFDAGLARRGLEPQSANILDVDASRRGLQTKIQNLQQERKQLAQQIGKLKSQGQNADTEQARARAINDEIAALEQEQQSDVLTDILSRIPNIPADEVPVGKDEHDNAELRRWGKIPAITAPKQHFDLGEQLGLMDFEQTAKFCGARFVTLSGALSRMERALAAFMLDMHTTEFGYTEYSPPLMVRDVAMYGVGQLPKFAEDSFETTTQYRLIPTAEVSLSNMVMDRIVAEEELPLRLTAFTPCFRSEAGSAGRDTRGMIRLHQFSKVELVSFTTPAQANEEHERMTHAAEEVLKRLELPYRVMLLCSGDMGFSSRKTYDLEVWLPGQNTYREISSCSQFGDFQARRLKARYKEKQSGENHFIHTLNGSALAVGRTIVAIVENYQQADGSIAVPTVLQPYMGGLKVIK